MSKATYALIVLAAACIHEFAWSLFPAGVGIQGNVRNITQWILISTLVLGFSVLAHDRFTVAVCMAVALMSSTTAGCSALWLAVRFQTFLGHDQCSRYMQMPMMLISACAAILTFWSWPHVKRR